MAVAYITAARSTCPRRKVGAVILSQEGHVMSTGYNGVPSGMPHCIDEPCPGAQGKSGEDLDKCIAIHAEQNAIAQCYDVTRAHLLVTTTSPCVSCIKQLIATNITTIVYADHYPHEASEYLWSELDRRMYWYGDHSAFLSGVRMETTGQPPQPKPPIGGRPRYRN